jgi:hypothetical protein
MGLFSRKSSKTDTSSNVAPGRNVAYQSPKNMLPKTTLPPAPDPAVNPAAYLRSIYAVSLAKRGTLRSILSNNLLVDLCLHYNQ